MKRVKRTIYIAGPMTGYPLFNFPAFDEAKKLFESSGLWNVISPADIDRAYCIHGDDPSFEFKPTKLDMAVILGRDLDALAASDAIFLMDGWQESKGANIEKLFAEIIGLEILYENGQEQP